MADSEYGYAVSGGGEASHPGYGDPSDTYRAADQGTDWPADAFTRMILAADEVAISRPAAHSYAGDGNMEAYHIVGPYSRDNEAARDLGAFTGATGPTGHVTPEGHPELTAPGGA
jgi:hypothetical protein